MRLFIWHIGDMEANMNVAVQLYTLRDETNVDFVGVLEKVAKIGYEGVEFAGYGDISAVKMKEYLKMFGLKVFGSHIGIDILTNKLDEEIEYNLEIGNKYIVLPGNQYGSKDDYLRAAEKYNEIGLKCKANGLQFCYHNHAHEFESFDGEYGLDIIFKNTDPQLVKTEIDTFWVYYAGVDPLDYLSKYSGRCPLVHIKDMEAGEDKINTEVGSGIIDIKSIITVAEAAGSECLIVEQDTCKMPSHESVEISFNNLQKILENLKKH